ncbi:MAG: hypothetical protein ACO3ZW_09950, partial [Opitutales bacterium]
MPRPLRSHSRKSDRELSAEYMACLVATVWPNRHHIHVFLPHRPLWNLHLCQLYLYVLLRYSNQHGYGGPDG